MKNVGILAEGSGFSLCASWLALLWAGYTVVPLSAEDSALRLKAICVDARIALVLVTDAGGATAAEALRNKDGEGLGQILDVRPLQERIYDSPGKGLKDCATIDSMNAGVVSLASKQGGYLYYTSGSSGKPNGVFSGHAPIMNRLRWMWRQWPYASDDVCCQRVSHVFIDFVAEVFGPLCRGVPIFVVPLAVRRNPLRLRDFIKEHGVTRITLVPTLARLLIQATEEDSAVGFTGRNERGEGNLKMQEDVPFFADIRLWILSGEILPWSIARGLARLSPPTAQVLNLYGSTEVAADVTFHSWSFGNNRTQHDENGGKISSGMVHGEKPPDGFSFPIGRPITGCGAELMALGDLEGEDEKTDAVPPKFLHPISPHESGRVGALYVCGEGLAGGYWDQPKLTEERFCCYTWDASLCRFRHCGSSSLVDRTSTSPPRSLSDTDQGLTENIINGSAAPRCRDGRVVRFFRTGDLASYHGSCAGEGDLVGAGQDEGWYLVYRGRADQQVKIHGQRLDLAEVETCAICVCGVKSAAAVAFRIVDSTLCGTWQEGRDDSILSLGECVIGVVVCPEVADRAAVLAECRSHLPSFAVPHVVMTASDIPTLVGSGKVNRQEVRRMIQDKFGFYENDYINNGGRAAGTVTLNDTSSCRGAGESKAELVSIVMTAVKCTLHSSDGTIDGVVAVSGQAGVDRDFDADTDFFVELGMSSLHAVRLVHELRRRLSRIEGPTEGNQKTCVVGLVDLFSHSSARKLARWLLSILSYGETANSTVGSFQGSHCGEYKRTEGVSIESAIKNEINASSWGQHRAHQWSQGTGVSIQPVTAEIQRETSILISESFLGAEPLLSARLAHLRKRGGPPAAALMRRCYSAAVKRDVDYLLRSGGRVLAAIDVTTGCIVGFTVGMELVPSAEGVGFFSGDGERRREQRGWIRRRMRKTVGDLLSLSLRPMLHPMTVLMDDLLNAYQDERGWAYAPGEIMYISDTGCHSERLAYEGGGRGGIRAAIVAESLERRLLDDASAAGFIRAITVCTNAVTTHVAHQLGFREVARVSPIQTYHPRGRHSTTGCISLASVDGTVSRHDRREFGVIFRKKSEPSYERPRQDERTRGQQGPFARVSTDHSDVVVFEKRLAPKVPPNLLLAENRKLTKREAPTGAIPSTVQKKCHDPVFTVLGKPNGSAAVTGKEIWKLVSVEETNGEQYNDMFALLANSLPNLAASGRAVRYMANDINRQQTAVVLLTAREVGDIGASEAERSAGAGNDSRGISLHLGPVPTFRWTVAACMSWCCHHSALALAGKGTVDGASVTTKIRDGRGNSGGTGSPPPSLGRELLLLAVGRRWRYRGVGSALVQRFLDDSRNDGETRVFVCSRLESVPFYERHEFCVAGESVDAKNGGIIAENGGGGATIPTVPSKGERLLVRELKKRS